MLFVLEIRSTIGGNIWTNNTVVFNRQSGHFENDKTKELMEQIYIYFYFIFYLTHKPRLLRPFSVTIKNLKVFLVQIIN